MLEFSPIVAEDVVTYNKYRAKCPSMASESSFTTLFIWNGYYNLECCENGEFLFIRFNIKGKEPSYFFPIGDGDIRKAIDELSLYSKSRNENLVFRLVSKENKEKLFELYGDRFSCEESRDCFDYIYSVEKMISLSGKKLHSKRNHLNYFLESYDFEYVEVKDSEMLEKCACKAYELVGNKTKNKNSYELGAMKSYFENYFKFSQTGGAILSDGEVIAMSFGEKIDDKTALIQIELADEGFRGAYQAINKFFCEKEWKEFEYVNREEDMGIEGLKKAKMSYQPQFLLEKYFIWEV